MPSIIKKSISRFVFPLNKPVSRTLFESVITAWGLRQRCWKTFSVISIPSVKMAAMG
ncbi:Uncharacterised protein [Vibrio cholerae]|nr:Uncharacterised protein [Vibrio cholerae]